MVIQSIRPFSRNTDSFQIFISMSDWPLAEIPLPPDAALWLGSDPTKPPRPFWQFYLRPEITVEKIVGIFIFPCPTTEAFAWYQAEMSQRGWTQHHNMMLPNRAFLRYRHPSENIKLELNLMSHNDMKQSWTVLSYVTIHPWPQVEVEA
jgi:hypothetical protein